MIIQEKDPSIADQVRGIQDECSEIHDLLRHVSGEINKPQFALGAILNETGEIEKMVTRVRVGAILLAIDINGAKNQNG